MLKYSVSRFLQTIVTLIGVSIILFLLLHVFIPGDPVGLMLGPHADNKTKAAFRKELGLDKSLMSQYLIYVEKVSSGDLGFSYRQRESVNSLLAETLPNTFLLAFYAVLLELILGVLAAIIAYINNKKFLDIYLVFTSIFIISIPTYWLGMLLQYWFGLKLNIFPISGNEGFLSFVLPVTSLALVSSAVVLKILRTGLVETENKDYVLLARAKGLTPRQVLLKHQLKNAFIPTLTYIGMDFGLLMTGAIGTEIVFNWPGVGGLIYDAILQRDYPVIISTILVLVVIYILINFIVDVLYGLLNPLARLKN